MSAGGVIICCYGPEKGATKKYRCPCCGWEANSMESFAMSTCWPCSSGDNLDCERCCESGVWIDDFDKKSNRGHRFDHRDGDDAVTACNRRIKWSRIGQGTAVRKPCLICWPEAREVAS